MKGQVGLNIEIRTPHKPINKKEFKLIYKLTQASLISSRKSLEKDKEEEEDQDQRFWAFLSLYLSLGFLQFLC